MSAARNPYQPRDQQIVAALATIRLPSDKKLLDKVLGLSSRLPSMFLRHGPLQVFLFLRGKVKVDEKGRGNEHQVIGAWMGRVFSEANPRSELKFVELFDIKNMKIKQMSDDDLQKMFTAVAGQSVQVRLRDQAICAEIATWLYRTLVAMTALDEQEDRS